MRRRETQQRKQALVGLKRTAGMDWMLGTLVRVIRSGKQALDAMMLEMGRMVAESVMLMEREEVAGPDYYSTDPAFQKWAHEQGSIYLGDQKVPVTRPRLRHVDQGEVTLQSYARLRSPGVFSEELLEKILRGVSAQKYADTVLDAAHAVGVSPTAISRKLVALTATKLKTFQERSLKDFTPFALFLNTNHRGVEAFLVALGVDVSGEKMALGFWQGSSENHEMCEALFRELEHRGLALSRRILLVTDGGSGLLKALRARFGKKLVHQRCAFHKSRNFQRQPGQAVSAGGASAAHDGLGADGLRQRPAPSAGVGGVAADEERVGGSVAPGSVRGTLDAPSAEGASVAAQDAPIHGSDREHVLVGSAQ